MRHLRAHYVAIRRCRRGMLDYRFRIRTYTSMERDFMANVDVACLPYSVCNNHRPALPKYRTSASTSIECSAFAFNRSRIRCWIQRDGGSRGTDTPYNHRLRIGVLRNLSFRGSARKTPRAQRSRYPQTRVIERAQSHKLFKSLLTKRFIRSNGNGIR